MDLREGLERKMSTVAIVILAILVIGVLAVSGYFYYRSHRRDTVKKTHDAPPLPLVGGSNGSAVDVPIRHGDMVRIKHSISGKRLARCQTNSNDIVLVTGDGDSFRVEIDGGTTGDLLKSTDNVAFVSEFYIVFVPAAHRVQAGVKINNSRFSVFTNVISQSGKPPEYGEKVHIGLPGNFLRSTGDTQVRRGVGCQGGTLLGFNATGDQWIFEKLN